VKKQIPQQMKISPAPAAGFLKELYFCIQLSHWNNNDYYFV